MSSLSPILQESTALEVGDLKPARGRGEALLRIALVAVVGPPVGAVAGLGVLLALLMAGSLMVVAALVLGFLLVALLATGAAG